MRGQVKHDAKSQKDKTKRSSSQNSSSDNKEQKLVSSVKFFSFLVLIKSDDKNLFKLYRDRIVASL